MRWLSVGLVAVGVLLLIASGVVASTGMTSSLASEPMVGLRDNPLPVIVVQTCPEPRRDGAPVYPVVQYVMPTASATSVPLPSPTVLPSPTLSPTRTASSPVAVPQTFPTPTPLPTPAPPPTPTPTLAVTGPPVRIVAPAIHLDAPVVSVGWQMVMRDDSPISVWEVADYAAGWHKSSALPGQPGNTVISGHHNTAGEVFRHVVDLKPGDVITLYTAQRPYTYTVETRLVMRDKGMPEEVRRDNARWIGPFPDERLTLVTCWPYNTNTHRVVVVARPAP
jgi:sortase A